MEHTSLHNLLAIAPYCDADTDQYALDVSTSSDQSDTKICWTKNLARSTAIFAWPEKEQPKGGGGAVTRRRFGWLRRQGTLEVVEGDESRARGN